MGQAEAYNLVLLVYIKVNQSAPISPPSREKVHEMFNRQDHDRKGQLGKADFKRLLLALLERTTARFVTYKFLAMIVSPILAWQVVRGLSGKVWLYSIGERLVPHRYAAMALKGYFWISVLTVVFMSTVGSFGLKMMDMFIERVAQMKEKKWQGTVAAAEEEANASNNITD